MNIKKIVIPSVLAISMLASVPAFAGIQKPMLHKKPLIQQNHLHKAQIGKGKYMLMKRTFFTNLVEKYSPETLDAWKATMDEAAKTRTAIIEIVKANPALKATLMPQHTEDLQAVLEAKKETAAAFHAALKSGEAEQIKAALANNLLKLQERNRLMAAKLVALQSSTAPSIEQPTVQNQSVTAPQPVKPQVTKPQIGKGKYLLMKRTFFTNLVEKYSPETLDAWKATMDAGANTRKAIVEIVKANPALKKTLKPIHSEDLQAVLESKKETAAAFHAALKSGDAEQIKAALANNLLKLQERNKVLAAKLAALQSASSQR